jgi:tetratricopeptide (TPR) repeat protein
MMRRFRGAGLALLAMLCAATVFAQAQGRVQATVVDENGEPIPDIVVTVTNPEIGYDQTFKTNGKGRFSVIFVDAARQYVFHFEKAGFQKTDRVLKPSVGENLKHTFEVPSVNAAPETPQEGDVLRSKNPAINTFNEGVIAFQDGDRATAVAKFREAMELDPELASPYLAMAGIYLEEGKPADAVTMAEKTVELEPENSRALRILYDAYGDLGDEAKAKQVLDRLKEVDTGTDTAIRVFNEGAEAARVGDLEGAAARFRDAVEVDPELAPAHAALARIYLAQKKYSEALAAAEEALGLDPGNTDVARQVFQEMATSDPEGTAQALYDRGVDMFNAGNTAGAKVAFEQALAANPDHARAHYMLALCLVNAGQSAAAKEHLQKFLELAPEDPDAGTAREMLEYVG